MTEPFRLLIDGSAGFNQGAGIGRYARNVVPAALRHIAGSRTTIWFASEGAGNATFEAEARRELIQASVRVVRTPIARRRLDQLWFRANARLPIQVLAGRQDLIYSPDFTAPPGFGAPEIVTVHDLAFLTHGERTSEALRRYLSGVVPKQLARAHRVIAVSETTKSDVLNHFNIEPERVVVVPNGVDERFFTAKPLDDRRRSELGIPREYLLIVGTLEPRKNHLNLFAAIAALSLSSVPPLVVAGKRGWEYEPILRAARPLVERGRVILLNYVPDDALPGLYAGASAVIYPSWSEGFGLPVLEGLAAGRPVVVSRIPSLIEVAGDCALYVDPSSPEEIGTGILAAMSRVQQSQVDERVQQARPFRWDTSGRRLAQVFVKASNGRLTFEEDKNPA